MTFNDEAQRMLALIDAHYQTWLAGTCGRYNESQRCYVYDEVGAANAKGEATRLLSNLAHLLDLDTPKKLTVALAEADRLHDSKALRFLGVCPRCQQPLERGWASTWSTEHECATDVFCSDCYVVDVYTRYADNGVLSSALSRHAGLDAHLLDRLDANDVLEQRNPTRARVVQIARAHRSTIRRFQAEHQDLLDVIRGQLQPLVRDVLAFLRDDSPVSATSGTTKVLGLASAGRALITLSAPDDSSVSVIGLDEADYDPRRVGIQGLDTTCQDGLALLREAAKHWNKKLMKKDRQVRIAGL